MGLTPPLWPFPMSPKVPRAREGTRVPTYKHTPEINHDVRERKEPRRGWGGGMGGVWGTEYRNLAWAEEHGPEDLGAEFGKRQRGLNEEEPSTPVFSLSHSISGGGGGAGHNLLINRTWSLGKMTCSRPLSET